MNARLRQSEAAAPGPASAAEIITVQEAEETGHEGVAGPHRAFKAGQDRGVDAPEAEGGSRVSGAVTAGNDKGLQAPSGILREESRHAGGAESAAGKLLEFEAVYLYPLGPG